MAEFADQAEVRVRAGHGGHGCASVHREKYKPLGGPNGGNGGRGGDVVFEVDAGTATLLDFYRRPVRRAGDGKPGSWGGHAIPVVAYDSRGLIVVTWGALQGMTWSFWEAYCDEAYAILSPDYLDGKQQAPQGFSLEQLEADLEDLK